LVGDVLEGPIPLIPVETVHGLIVGDIKIGKTIPVVISPGDSFGEGIEFHAGFAGYIAEGAVTLILKQL
jgi:hypothetical protein